MAFGRLGSRGLGREGSAAVPPLPPNFMPFSEDVTQFSFTTGGAGNVIPHIWSTGSTLNVGTKTTMPQLPNGASPFTCTGLCADPDNSNYWVGNFGAVRNGGGGTNTPISIVQVTSAFAFVSQVQLPDQTIGGIQGVAFVNSPGLKCLAYADGTNGKVYFINRDGSVPRSPMVLPFGVNALAWDNARQALWVGNAANGDVWCVTLGGVFLSYADFNNWGGPIDHICVDASRGTAGNLILTSGPNGSPGILIAYDVALDQIVNRYALDSAQAVEGIIASGTSVLIVSDGDYHQYGSGPNTVAPYNVNEAQTYTLPSTIPQWRYARVYKAAEIAGPFGRQPYRMLLDRGDGDASTDFCLVTRVSDVAAGSANVALTAKPFDPAVPANIGLRLLNGSLTNVAYAGPSYSRGVVLATAAAAAQVQIGTRGTMTPDRVINATATALAVNTGTAGLSYKARLGA